MGKDRTENSVESHCYPVLPCHSLCKFRGMLVIAEISVRTDGEPGRCPECGSTEFSEHNGWTECDCGFAYLSSDLERLTG